MKKIKDLKIRWCTYVRILLAYLTYDVVRDSDILVVVVGYLFEFINMCKMLIFS